MRAQKIAIQKMTRPRQPIEKIGWRNRGPRLSGSFTEEGWKTEKLLLIRRRRGARDRTP